MIEHIPVTSAARTLVDIAGCCDVERVEDALDDALRRGVVSLLRMRWELRGNHHGRRGVEIMRALVDERDPREAVTESTFETHLFRALRRRGLPLPVKQFHIAGIGDIDFAYPDKRIGIEADSFQWHGARRARWEKDIARHNAALAIGWRIPRITWRRLVHDPTGVADEIAALYYA